MLSANMMSANLDLMSNHAMTREREASLQRGEVSLSGHHRLGLQVQHAPRLKLGACWASFFFFRFFFPFLLF